ncbi:THxN family PEP-CTERM protein [Roseococcus pinisoli]|uniref:THxN family PEP-CTERM protein n=1 Tax=Roseococcus pinisoli TaxID=2835040 RepID=A0ABS5QE95_9PROT|nr:THxN family PEP-CTERM protein [Roseococcus pinisoli]MBS7812014.1 THxN family PEP-CTERM protein [Roseococcus pinisoli]
MFMNMRGAASAAALSMAVIFGPAVASAASVTINATAPSWSNVVGGTNVNTGTSGTGNNTVTQVHWGSPSNSQSGLGFNPANPPAAVVNTDTTFLLGTLTHYNEPINSGTAASSARLNLATTIAGAVPSTQTFSYQFLIDETPNTPPCAYPSTTPCADRITFNNLTTSSSFMIGGVPYTIELLGFSSNGGATISSSFISQEGGSNSIQLYARITTPTPVPEPASFAILGAGLLGLAAARKRRQS